MANILIIDDQQWVKDLCKEGLEGQEHEISMTGDIESVRENVSLFKPDLVLLNLYLQHGFLVWDVLHDIKMQDPDLPVLIVAANDKYLFEPRLSRADGYLVKSNFGIDEFKGKITALIRRRST